MTRLFTKNLVKLSLIIQIIISLCLTTTNAQTCKGFTFPNNKLFATCNDLPVLNSYLYWTYNTTTGTADIAFRATGVSPSSNWVAWALNPTGQGMAGAQALVALQGTGTAMRFYTSNVLGPQISTLQQSNLSFQVSGLLATSSSTEIIIFATIKPPTTTVNQVWQVGPVSGGNPAAHPQSGPNIQSTGTIDFLTGQSTSNSDGGSRQRRKNTHGVLNAISWGTLMPLGAIIARYLRVFKSADPAWFYMHIVCQCSAYILGVLWLGFGCKLGSESVGIAYQPHRNIGIALFCLATLQVFALFLRTHKDSKYRIYWNVYHHATGYSVIILSVINIYKGFDILEPLKKWKTTYTAIIIILGVIALLLEAFTWAVVLKRKKNNSDKHDHHANGANGHSNGSNPFGHGV
ncbi:cytochrome b561 and DOMON domain-containing protein At5g47530-like [Silene latifolia]|uniref:cytochrome b561 and DOMON domain-containing protein At5g47530-like n=1 Tax=Silene latifolia TaxID=37657 RepID=UPI003D777591